MESRYLRNQALWFGNAEAQENLATKTVLIVGCGGLGGYVIEGLARAGIGNFILCDPDTFEESNLNRQLYALPSTLGMKKTEIAEKRILSINPDAKVQAYPTKFQPHYLNTVDIVADCLGGAEDRQFLENEVNFCSISMVSAGISGWSALVTTKLPKGVGLGKYMGKSVENHKDVAEKTEGSPVFSVMFAASLQVSEILQILCYNTAGLGHKILVANLKESRFQVMEKQ